MQMQQTLFHWKSWVKSGRNCVVHPKHVELLAEDLVCLGMVGRVVIESKGVGHERDQIISSALKYRQIIQKHVNIRKSSTPKSETNQFIVN